MAAEQLIENLVDAIDSSVSFPYACPVHNPVHSFEYEYRKMIVQNYLMFYWVDEKKKVITIARVIYAKRDYNSLLADEPNKLP